jgi:chaperone required for assembly of F1-ATPase
MSAWKAKRFWKAAAVTEAPDGYGVQLDARPVRTPAKAALVVPTRALAGEIAREWDAVDDKIESLDSWALTAFHDLVSLSGSLVIGFAALYDLHPAEMLWGLSRIDETWQQEQWGSDEEAQFMAARKESDFLHAKRFYDISRADATCHPARFT